MPESLLTLLKLLLLALLYLFFARVLYVVWSEMASPQAGPAQVGGDGAAAAASTSSSTQSTRRRKRNRIPERLVVVAPPDQQGRAYSLDSEQTVGRSPGCQVSLDDTFASQVHARIFRSTQGCFVEDLGSTNGTFLNDLKVTSPTQLNIGDRLKIGSTELEVA